MQPLQRLHRPAAVVKSGLKAAASALVAVMLGLAAAAGASTAAAEPLRTPQPDRLYLGRMAYETWQPIVLKTSPDGRRLKAAPGYFNHLSRCGARGGNFFDTTIYSKQWLAVRANKTFSGAGRGRTWLDTEQGWRGVYSWTITGRFTSPRRAAGRITITGAIHDDGRLWLRCPARTIRWETKRTESAPGNLRNW